MILDEKQESTGHRDGLNKELEEIEFNSLKEKITAWNGILDNILEWMMKTDLRIPSSNQLVKSKHQELINARTKLRMTIEKMLELIGES